jgi:lipid A 4'-phosphatase
MNCLQKINSPSILYLMKWLIPLILFTPFSAKIDLALTRYFFTEGHFSQNPFFTFIYDYGERPAQVAALFGLLAYLFRAKKEGLYLFLTLVIGAFLINEAALKNHWGRPRPRQVIEFGGKQPFRPYYSPNLFAQPEPSKSFPCGHCTAGFYFFTLAFLGKRRRSLYLAGMALSLIFGSLLGLTRIAQGGHFFSDVVFGMLVMYWTAKLLDHWMLRERTYETAS